ncbi:MAG: hypothetical protein ACXW1C_06135 [Gallionella sp.]
MNTSQPHATPINRESLNQALLEAGGGFARALGEQHDHLFADVALTISSENLAQMQAVIAAVEAVVGAGNAGEVGGELGVFYGYDFHLNADGAHLIEINSNAGGAFLNALLIASQRESGLLTKALADADLSQSFIAMFRHEWQLARGDASLNSIAIVDESPSTQYLYPEFLLAKSLFENSGIEVFIVDPAELQTRDEGLYVDEQKIDLIYNRLTDFSLQQFPHLLAAYENNHTVFTPNPAHYQRYADKRKLVALSDADFLQSTDVAPSHINALLRGIPQTKLVHAEDSEAWWTTRKQWFFKPVNGYGSRGAYRGDKLTRRVFEEIMQADYVAQKLAMPGEITLPQNGSDTAQGELPNAPTILKFDVRCYVYDGHIQLVAARLYQGQTTNFRTAGGGFALLHVAA